MVETGALEHFPNRDEMLRDGRSRRPAGRMLVPQDLRERRRLAGGTESSMVIGQTLIVDGGYSLPA